MKIKEMFEKHKIIIVCICIILALISLNIYTFTLTENEEPEIKAETPKEEKPKTIKVDLKGEVNAKGVYEMTEGSRITDVINKAGGLTKNADISILNLSKKLKDEMVIIIYSKDEVNKMKVNKEEKPVCPVINDACITNETIEPLLENKTKTENKEVTNKKVSLNNATIEELQTLTGIGESKAKAIITYRETKGQFKTIEDLKNVSGIGDAIFDKIKNQITI